MGRADLPGVRRGRGDLPLRHAPARPRGNPAPLTSASPAKADPRPPARTPSALGLEPSARTPRPGPLGPDLQLSAWPPAFRAAAALHLRRRRDQTAENKTDPCPPMA